MFIKILVGLNVNIVLVEQFEYPVTGMPSLIIRRMHETMFHTGIEQYEMIISREHRHQGMGEGFKVEQQSVILPAIENGVLIHQPSFYTIAMFRSLGDEHDIPVGKFPAKQFIQAVKKPAIQGRRRRHTRPMGISPQKYN